MEKYNGLPLYKLVIDESDETGIDAIALVDQPATEVNWMKFSKQLNFQIEEEKRNITAPIMLADTPIYRYHPSMGEYYVMFTSDEIEKMVKKYFKTNKIHSVNEMHDSERPVQDVFLIESWIVTSDTDKSKGLGFDVPVGTWMATFHVQSHEYWNEKIKSGEFKGFSLEGAFDMSFNKVEELTDEEMLDKITEIVQLDLSDDDILDMLKKLF